MAKAKKLMAAAVFTGFCLSVTGAAAQEPSAQIPYISDFTNPGVAVQVEKDQIKEYEQLVSPFTHAISLHGRDGIAYVSQNGRFILRGVIFDTWNGETIQTMDQLRNTKKTLNLSELGLKDEDIDPMFYGTGPKKVTVFVDPLCPFCGQLFDEMLGNPSYAQEYTFKILTVPFLGDDSTKAVTAISCATNREEALRALMTKDRRWMQTQAAPESCNPEPIMQRTILSQMLGVTGVPYIIGAEGGIARGMPADLRTFLASN
ncbi:MULTISPECIES: DsbC family protein [Falsigemmobacter]|uniref:Thiol:disulfide interchange protein n=2 Tax=Falsigemmobacter TaxID=2780027 RepID=A0A451GGS9_9RHOB|nr:MULTISPECIES: DsbC family protein [Falsigemmobacter]RRH74426.1 DsbC family protein [Falsigemmobacter faecalis]RWY36422.1 DsbC family protein [Falsigemmobacter intermedius]